MLQSTPEGINLSHMSLSAAFSLAVSLSRSSRDDIEAGMDWSPEVASRIFNPSDNYWPSLPSLPRLCAVLGNTILAEWIAIRAGVPIYAERSEQIDVATLLTSLEPMLAECGSVVKEAGRAVADGAVTPAEARRILREIYDMLSALSPMIAGLQALREGGRS